MASPPDPGDASVPASAHRRGVDRAQPPLRAFLQRGGIGAGNERGAPRRPWFRFLTAIVLACALIAANEMIYRHAREAAESVAQANRFRVALATLMQNVLDAETGQRGYLLTGDTRYLAPYTAAVSAHEDTLLQMRSLVVGDPKAQDRFFQLRNLLQRKFAELEIIINLRRAGAPESAWRAILESGSGALYMENIRRLYQLQLEDVTHSRDAALAEVAHGLQVARIGVPAACLIALIAFVFYLRQVERALVAADDAQLQDARRCEALEAQVQARTASLAELANHLQGLQESEREALARELHDELGSLLTTAKLDVARIKSKLGGAMPALSDRVDHLVATLNAVIELKRRIIEDLRPSTLSKLGLRTALALLLDEWRQSAGIDLDYSLDQVRLSDVADLAVYRLVQESLTNIAKYAHASAVNVLMQQYEHHVEIEIRDNGRGFDANQLKGGRGGGHGLEGMHYRFLALQGRVSVESVAGQGTVIRASLPRPLASTPPPRRRAPRRRECDPRARLGAPPRARPPRPLRVPNARPRPA